MSKTATVEVLTAAVRVLMVGSRQITLSVFNQLDAVAPDDIQPFGRVRAKLTDHECTEVVGADATGQLCRSWLVVSDLEYRYPGRTREAVDHDPEADRLYDMLEAWQVLPLIVLAGLR